MNPWQTFICRLARDYGCPALVMPTPVPMPDDMPQPDLLGDITGSELRRELWKYFPFDNVHIADGLYLTTDIASLERFLAWDKTNEMEYRKEFFDCDNSTFKLLGKLRGNPNWDCTPSGLFWGDFGHGNHSLNIFCDYQHDLFFVEPQTDAIVPVRKLSRVQVIVV